MINDHPPRMPSPSPDSGHRLTCLSRHTVVQVDHDDDVPTRRPNTRNTNPHSHCSDVLYAIGFEFFSPSFSYIFTLHSLHYSTYPLLLSHPLIPHPVPPSPSAFYNHRKQAMVNIPTTAMQSENVEPPTPASNHGFSDIEKLAVTTVKTPLVDSPRPIHGWRWGLAGKLNLANSN